MARLEIGGLLVPCLFKALDIVLKHIIAITLRVSSTLSKLIRLDLLSGLQTARGNIRVDKIGRSKVPRPLETRLRDAILSQGAWGL